MKLKKPILIILLVFLMLFAVLKDFSKILVCIVKQAEAELSAEKTLIKKYILFNGKFLNRRNI